MAQDTKKYKKSYVISLRISDEDMDWINRAMETQQISKISHLMRQVIGVVKERPADQFQGVSGQITLQ